MKCPCYSGKQYSECCLSYHNGKKKPKAAVELMRSRYAAYALNLPEYIIETTHPKNPQYVPDRQQWKKEIEIFSKSTVFSGLEILDSTEEGDNATVTFTASLSQNGQDISFIEKSRFRRENEQWLYLSGEIH